MLYGWPDSLLTIYLSGLLVILLSNNHAVYPAIWLANKPAIMQSCSPEILLASTQASDVVSAHDYRDRE